MLLSPPAPLRGAPVPATSRRLLVEAVGTAFLVLAVVGSGIAATELTQDRATALLVNAAATAGALYVLITVLGPLSGAHLNPIVSVALVVAQRSPHVRRAGELAGYVSAQVMGGFAGVAAANAMFGHPVVRVSTLDRASGPVAVGEFVASSGLVVLVLLLAARGAAAAGPVAAYIGSGYFVTSSTAFANPAVTIGRTFTDSFTGISPGSVPVFIGAQLLAVAAGVVFVVTLLGRRLPPVLSEELP